MKNKLNFYSLMVVVFLLLCTHLYAQSDPKSVDILKSVSAKYKSLSSVKAEFTIAQEAEKGKSSDKQKGTIILKGKKYKLDIAGQEIINDGATNWSFLKEANEIQISDASENDAAVSPANIFTMYEKGFLSKYIDEKMEGGKTIINIELTPTDKSKKIFKIKLSIDKSEKLVVSAKIFDKNGNHYTYSVDKFTPNFAAPDNLFTMDAKAHPKAEIIDLR